MINLEFIRDIVPERIFSFSLLDSRPNLICIRISGVGAENAFSGESGGHRWQRVPPTEKRGRRHTSTFTVAVLHEPKSNEIDIDYRKLEIKTCRGSGPGGQHRNKTDSAVQLKYGDITIRCESERSQKQNKDSAIAILKARLFEEKNNRLKKNENDKRKNQIGSGMRGDKTRTIRVFDNIVKDNNSGNSISFEKYQRGFLEIFNS